MNFNQAIEIAKYYRSDELENKERESVRQALYAKGYYFAKVRRLYYIGYIFQNWNKSIEQLAVELNLNVYTIKILRSRMTLPHEVNTHGGDRRSKGRAVNGLQK